MLDVAGNNGGHLKVLDYGCGNGSLGFLGDDSTGLFSDTRYDADPFNRKARYHMLEEMERESFDLVVNCHVVEHCDVRDLIEIMKWCRNVSSRLIVTTPNAFDNPYYNFFQDITHVRPYNNQDLLFLLTKCGRTVKKVIVSNMGPKKFWPARIPKAVFEGVSPFFDYTVVYQ